MRCCRDVTASENSQGELGSGLNDFVKREWIRF